MILRSIKVANWKCLSEVQIGPLAPGITVIHAPNRTGKSSLIEAVKLALVDLHFDTGLIKKYAPWKCSLDAIPGVEIEFLAKGEQYLMEKKFSKKYGRASLYRLAGDGNKTTIAEGKEVTEETQKLIGMSASKFGIPRLLWVEQGSVGMPTIDDQLGQMLRPMLGAILTTETDYKTREELSNKINGWFTASNIKKKAFFTGESSLSEIDRLKLNEKGFPKNCEVLRLKEDIEDTQRKLEDIKNTYKSIESEMGDAERLRHDLLRSDVDIKQAEKEVEELNTQDEKIEEKREKARELKGLIDDMKNELLRLEEEEKSFTNNLNEKRQLDDDLKEKKKEFDTFRDARDSAKEARDKLKNVISQIERQLEEIDSTRSLLEIKKNIIDLEKEITELEKTLKKTLELENKIKERREELSAIVTPNENDTKNIIKTLKDRDKLQAEIEASQLVLSIKPDREFLAKLKIDHKEEEDFNFIPGEELVRNVRQKLNISIPEIGVIDVKRGQEDEDIEKLAGKQAKAFENLKGLLAPLGINHAMEMTEIITEVEKRSQKASELERRIQDISNDLDELAPQGVEELKAEKDRHKVEKANLIGSREELKNWEPSKTTLKEDQKQFKEAEDKLKGELSEARRNLKTKEKDLSEAQDKLSNIGDEVSLTRGKLEAKKEHVTEYQEKYSSTDKLNKNIASKNKEIGKKEQEYEKYRLTKEEENIQERLEGARQARIKRMEHREEISNQLVAVEERLKKAEGLHSTRTALEQSLTSKKRFYKQIVNMIKAHCILILLYDHLRDENIESSLKPVSDQMDRWLREMYGENSKKIIFGSNLDPNKIATDGGESKDFPASTSYGELEQLSTLVRLAYGVVIAKDEPQVVILDEPIAHSDPFHHRKMLTIFEDASKKNLQILIFTCEPQAFDHIKSAERINLEKQLRKQY